MPYLAKLYDMEQFMYECFFISKFILLIIQVQDLTCAIGDIDNLVLKS